MPELIKKKDGELVYFQSNQLIMSPAVRHAFFTRRGGVSEGVYSSLNFRFNGSDTRENVLRNFAIGAGAVEGSLDYVVRTCQKHTDNIEVVREKAGGFRQVGEGAGCDAVMTDIPGVVLAGFYADCQLVILYDDKNKAIAVVHAGWRGVANQIVAKTVERMGQEYGTQPKNLFAVVGPSICRQCFETDSDVKEMLFEIYQEQIPDYFYRQGEKWHIDLKMLTYSSFMRLGLMPHNVDISNICPCCEGEDLFWSHRKNGEERGVHAGMIMLKR